SWRAEIHDLADNISRLEREGATREFGWQNLAELFFKRHHVDASLGSQGEVHHRLVRATGPQEHRIDGVTGALRADVTQADVDVARPGRSLDLVQDARHQTRGVFRAGSGGRVETQTELMPRNVGKQFRTYERSQKAQDRQHDDDVNPNHRPAQRSKTLKDGCPAASHFVEV